ncbi:hypothetical protein Rhe02_54810 [Rhizocola hellebori]|uniref:DUF2190 family protein n=1 Tax=Rhizocola hellebori TaxID=1392758 RepID=A0A8J3QCR4_9ACTN|nr:hypothetical protein [Rhizocola hellebori]GIH07414.1 hypothetical protein Rhe02_54810 [Rhizocola hellebori]
MPYTGGFPNPAVKSARARWDFSVDGGAVGAISIGSTGQIPAGAYITHGFVEVDTAVTSSASGTLAIHVEAADDIVAAAAVSGAPWSTTGLKSIVPVATGATAKKTTAARTITATIATGALTAGVVDVVLFYVVLGD